MRDGVARCSDAPCGMHRFTLLFGAKRRKMEYHTIISHRTSNCCQFEPKKLRIYRDRQNKKCPSCAMSYLNLTFMFLSESIDDWGGYSNICGRFQWKVNIYKCNTHTQWSVLVQLLGRFIDSKSKEDDRVLREL